MTLTFILYIEVLDFVVAWASVSIVTLGLKILVDTDVF